MCNLSSKYGAIKRVLIYSLILFGFLCSEKVQAQFPSDKGWFSSNHIYGCIGLTITVTHERTGAGSLFVDFNGDPNNILAGEYKPLVSGGTESFTYTTPGTYFIVVVDQSGTGSDADRTDFLEMTILPDQLPVVAINSCSANSVELVFNKQADQYDGYSILFGDNTSLTVDGESPVYHSYTSAGTYRINIQGVLTNGESFSCARFEESVTVFDQIPTPIINSIQVGDETTITLDYQALDVSLNYKLQVDRGAGFEDLTDINPSVNSQSISINDPSFNTRTNFYAFKIIAEDNCQTNSAESEIGYSIAFDILSETVDTSFDFTVDWSTGNQNFNSIDLLIDGNNFQTFNNADSGSGQIVTFSDCTGLGDFSMTTTINGIVSNSIIRIPFESGSPTLPAPEPPTAELTGAVMNITFPSTNFPLGQYLLFRKDLTADFVEVFSTSSNQHTDTTIPGGTGQVCYKIAYADECGNISALSDEICIVLSTTLGIPNAFSPNGDGVNDIFKITDGIYANFKMAIFNRWGTIVFNSTDPSVGWDGQFEGQPVNSGTYLYQISFQNADNLLITRTGSFVLIR